MWTKDDIEILNKYYGKINTKYLLDLLINKNLKIEDIKHKSKELGLYIEKNSQRRKYYYNENFFNEPNLINCYIAGFISADGNICFGDDTRITLHEKDEELLLNIKKEIDYTGKILTTRIKYKTLCLSHGLKWHKKLLEHWNITENKTFTLIPPKEYIKNDLAYSFIIGNFDGDGCWHSEKNNKNQTMSFLGTFDMVNWIKYWINNIVPENRKIKITKRPGHYGYHCSGKRALEIRNKLLEIDLPFRLWRKWI